MTNKTREKIHQVTELLNNSDFINPEDIDWGEITDGYEEDAMMEVLDCTCDDNMVEMIIAAITHAWQDAINHEDPICYESYSNGRFAKYDRNYTIDYVLEKLRKKRVLNVNLGLQNKIEEYDNTNLKSITKEEFDEIFPPDDLYPKDKAEIIDNNEHPQATTTTGEEIESLRNDLKAFQTMDRKGKSSPMFSSKQMAIFLKAMLLKYNSLTNNVKTLAPLLQKFGGWTADTASNALGYKVTQEECDELAKAFLPYTPAISKIITDFPKEYDKIKGQRLSANLKK